MFYLQSPVGNRTVIHTAQKGRAGFDSLRQWKASWFASGTAALSAAVKTAVVARGLEHPEVLLPAYGCPDLVAAIRHAGAKPFFVDLSPDSFRMNSLTVADVISRRPSVVALIGVDLFGCPENWSELYELCHSNDIVKAARKLTGTSTLIISFTVSVVVSLCTCKAVVLYCAVPMQRVN